MFVFIVTRSTVEFAGPAQCDVDTTGWVAGWLLKATVSTSPMWRVFSFSGEPVNDNKLLSSPAVQ